MNVNIDAMELLNALAEQIGTTVPLVMQWYIDRMVIEIVEAAVTFLFMIAAGCLVQICTKNLIKATKERKGFDDDFGHWLVLIVVLTVFAGLAIGTVIETLEAVKAYLSPEAYAFDRILSRLK